MVSSGFSAGAEPHCHERGYRDKVAVLNSHFNPREHYLVPDGEVCQKLYAREFKPRECRVICSKLLNIILQGSPIDVVPPHSASHSVKLKTSLQLSCPTWILLYQ